MEAEIPATLGTLSLNQVEARKPITMADEFKERILGNYGFKIVATYYLTQGTDPATAKQLQDLAADRKSDEISAWWLVKAKQYAKFLEYASHYTIDDVNTDDPETIMTTKTNDTPTDEGDYSQDKYTSNVVRTNSVQKRSKVQKYIEARETLVNDIYPKIVQEFYDTFVIEQQEGLF